MPHLLHTTLNADLHVPLASHPLQHLVGEHLTGSADGVAALGAIDGGAPTGHPTDGHPKIVSSVKDPQEALQSTTLPSPPPKKAKPVVVSPPDEVISGQGPSLDQATLAGGWMLTPEIFHRAASHPNAVVVSKEKPYIVQYKGFLSQAEIDHLLELSGGEPVWEGGILCWVVWDSVLAHNQSSSLGTRRVWGLGKEPGSVNERAVRASLEPPCAPIGWHKSSPCTPRPFNLGNAPRHPSRQMASCAPASCLMRA